MTDYPTLLKRNIGSGQHWLNGYILLLLDLARDNPLSQHDVEQAAKLEPTAARRVLRASDYGAAATAHGVGQDYAGAARAISRMVREARDGIPPGEAPRFYVAGRAPLPIFGHLGWELSSFADDVTLINRRPDGQWDVLPMQGVTPTAGKAFFEIVKGLDGGPRETSGVVALFLSTHYAPVKQELCDHVAAEGLLLADIVEVRAHEQGEKLLDDAQAPRAANELLSIFKRVHAIYPRSEGVVLFVAGPAPLAFMAGRAINQHIIQQVWLPTRGGVSGGEKRYQRALQLPVREPLSREVSRASAAISARERILGTLREQLGKLRLTLRPEHLPPAYRGDTATRLLKRLEALEVSREPQGGAFDLRVSERSLAFGEGLLEALRELREPEQTRIGLCLVLHELFHVDQNLSTELYVGVGRAGVALEEVDYWADAFAVETLATWEVTRKGDEGRERTSSIVGDYIDAVLLGMTAFDSLEQGQKLDRLPERRLRRYLLWHLQRARANTLHQPDDLRRLFSERLVVELAPLRGHLDHRFDKVVEVPLAETELFVVLGGRLLRTSRQGEFDPHNLVQNVRTFQHEALQKSMSIVREKHRPVLTPWVP